MKLDKLLKNIGKTDYNLDIKLFETLPSTNLKLKELAVNGAKEGTIIIANTQTQGRGRFTRRFFSPDSTGLYMSLLVRPKTSPADALLITTATAVAVAEAIDNYTDKKAQIKWVNDILLDGKKVCGILTESGLNTQTGLLDFAVVGIGVNISTPSSLFPDDIKEIAGSIFKEEIPYINEKIAAEIIKNFFKYYYVLEEKSYLSAYKERSAIIGKKINVIRNTTSIPAIALDIDDYCRLKVKYDTGEEAFLSSGEISIKL